MLFPSRLLSLMLFFLHVATHGNAQPTLISRVNSKASAATNSDQRYSGSTFEIKKPFGESRADVLTKYEQTCALRFFEFCDYLLSPPDIVIDSASYRAGEKEDDIIMQREREGDTARIKKAVLRYTIVPEPTNTSDSVHFSPHELSDQDYRRLEMAFATMEKLLDTVYNAGGTPLKLIPLRLHKDAIIHSQVDPHQLSRTFLLMRGSKTLAVLLFTPRDRMTATRPPRICGWSVDFRHGRMIFHNLAATAGPGTASVWAIRRT